MDKPWGKAVREGSPHSPGGKLEARSRRRSSWKCKATWPARGSWLALNATAERSPGRAVAPAALVVARGWWGVLVLAKVNQCSYTYQDL